MSPDSGPRSLRGWTVFTTPAFLFAAVLVSNAPSGAAEELSPEKIEFFEKQVRPLLVDHCQKCHGSEKQEGGLRLDSRSAVLRGGDTGPLFSAEKPSESLLVEAINYDPSGYQMPPSGKLSDEAIAVLTKWVELGAPWPGSDREPADGETGFDLAARAAHWSFQPIQPQTPPYDVSDTWSRNPVDRFIASRLREAGLTSATEADRRRLIRRLTFDLIGLPPTTDEVAAFVEDTRPDAYERLVDRLLDSPAYGERWARHWLDLVRYAESYGHEFDFDIESPTPYRDYVIRAWNQDVPYDLFVREHVAGDLLPSPRLDPVTGLEESVQGTAFWWFGQGKHSPVDIRLEECDTVDNQIDVLGKTFLGLTIACARCHDHKFDAITTADYYAIAGYLQSSRQHLADRNPPEVTRSILAEIAACDQASKAILEGRTADGLTQSAGRLTQITAEMGDAVQNAAHPWHPLASLANFADPAEFVRQRDALRERLLHQAKTSQAATEQAQSLIDFTLPDWNGWFVHEQAFGDHHANSGEAVLQADPHRPIRELISMPSAHSGREAGRLQGTLRSPTFPITHRYLDVLARKVGGEEHSPRRNYKSGLVNVIVDGFQIIRNPLYGHLSQNLQRTEAPEWRRFDLAKFQGQSAYLEIEDFDDGSVSLLAAQLTDGPVPPRQPNEVVLQLLESDRAASFPELVNQFAARVREIAGKWHEGHSPSGASADFLNPLLARLSLPDDPRVVAWAQERARLESRLPTPVRTLAMVDGTGENETILIRGNPTKRGAVVARRFLEVFEGNQPSKADSQNSGREHLANAIVSEKNPLAARVIVNRLWQHHFGQGIVPTPDDFGHMGQPPSHPELLDWLAAELIRGEWSLKRIQRLIVMSATYRQSSFSTDASAAERDPQNILLHRQNIRRLEAEAIRDQMLALSGQLDQRIGGPSIPPHLTPFMEGRGRPGASGPLNGDGRRSLYIGVRRNFLSPFFLAFDFPTPFTTMGRRSSSNVPAQALTLMNNPFVVDQAAQWASRSAASPDRLSALYGEAYGRPPTAEEAQMVKDFLASYQGNEQSRAWADLCHVLWNAKEFVFIE